MLQPEIIRPWAVPSTSAQGGTCFETQFLSDGSVEVRHSQHPEGPVLTFTGEEWGAMLIDAKAGKYDQMV